MHSIFQIRISRNTKCADKTGFPRPGHIFNYIIRTLLLINAWRFNPSDPLLVSILIFDTCLVMQRLIDKASEISSSARQRQF